jgi:hypothetical protein
MSDKKPPFETDSEYCAGKLFGVLLDIFAGNK